MTNLNDLDAIKARIPTARTEFFRARDLLAASLGQPTDVVDHVLQNAFALGEDQVLRLLSRFPFSVTIPSHQTTSSVISALRELYRKDQQLCELITARDRLLLARDPSHQKVTLHLGHEYIVNPSAGTYTNLTGSVRR